jgi:DHA1 family tetracycline resistance protein-like MFS transporter
MTEIAETTVVPRRRAALMFIFVTVLVDILSFGVIIPVLPHLVQRFLDGDIARAALWAGIISSMFALVQFITTPIQGALSDRFGRRPVILLSNLGTGIDFVFMALVNTLPLLFIGRLISGIAAASFSTANAYIADITPAEKRAAAFGKIGAAFGVGFVIGPAVGSFLSTIDLRAPFWLAAGLALANFLYGYLVLPESLPPEKRSPRFDWKRANPIGAVGLLAKYPQVLGLAAVVFLSSLAHYVLPATFVLYADHRYHWSEARVGYVLALVGACNIVVQAVLVGKFVRAIGERRTLLIGLAFGVVGFLGMGLSPAGWIYLCTVPFMALWGLSGPATQALLTQRVNPHEFGRIQGAVTSVMSVGGIFGPFMFSSVFAHFIGPHAPLPLPGAAFVLAALLLALAAGLGAWITRVRAVAASA